MSVNCPKCGFQQPEDQYCASCGVDMTKFQPKEAPLWQRLISNWLVQLGLLICFVFVLIIRDNISSPSKSTLSELPSPPPQTRSAFRDDDGKVLPPPVAPGSPKVLPPPMKTAKASAVVADPIKPSPSKVAPTNTNTSKGDNLPKARAFKKKVASFFYLVPQNRVESLLESNGTSAADGITVVRASDFKKELKAYRKDWKKLDSQSQSFEFSKPKLIFVGTTAGDTENRVGYYIRTTVETPETVGGTLNVDLRAWSELIPGEPGVDGPSSVLDIRRGDTVFVSNLVPRDLVFTEQQKSDFEETPTLNALNDPRYLEENFELILVLQYK